LLHGPAELGYPALSLPLVNVDATLDRLEGLDKSIISTFRDVAAALFYKNRTWPAIIKAAGRAEDRAQILQLLHAATVNQKRADALALVRAMVDFSPQTPAKRGDWSFRATTLWRSVADQPEKQ
ncbi:MAG: TfuA-like protein, partial [Shinella sp.]